MQIVDESAAYAAAGPNPQSFAAGGAQVLMGDEGMAVIAEIGDDLSASGLRSCLRFTLTGPVVPAEFNTVLKEKLHTVRHQLFVRIPEGLLRLGPGRSFHSHWMHNGPVLCEADINLDQPLSWGTLDLVRPPAPPAELPGIGWLDHLNDDRPRALREFAEGWYPRTPLPPAEAEADARPTVPVPRALADFYQLARDRPGLMGRQNFLRPPAEVELDASGRIHFGDENQGGFVWALASGDDTDAQVLISEDHEVWHSEREPLSGFLMQFALYEAFNSAPYRAWLKVLSRKRALEMIGNWRPVPLHPFLAWQNPVTFAVAPGLLAHLHLGDPNDDECMVSVVATDRSVLRPLRALNLDWRVFDG
jgi:hypothetical protein